VVVLLCTVAVSIAAWLVAVAWWWRLAVLLFSVSSGLSVWRWQWAPSFDRVLRFRLRSWWRNGRLYGRLWDVGMESAGLTSWASGHRAVPARRRVWSTAVMDEVRVELLPGQTLEDYAAVSDRLAQTFGALDCRAHGNRRRPHEIRLWFLTKEPLESVVPPLPSDVDALGAGLPVARGEDGLVHRMQIIGTHVLVVGATGSGKGSVLWSILVALRPAITARLVRVWAIDPKGGMELALGADLFDRFCHGDAAESAYEEAFAELLEEAVVIMRHRQDQLRGIARLHQPTAEEPLIVVVIDELAALTGWVMDRNVKRRIEGALGLLLSQGRAVGVVIVGAIQDPRKEVLPLRDLFPTRICLRVNESEHVALALGQGARARGAFADRIPEQLPGVGYVVVDGVAEPRRVRFSFVSDADIATACLMHSRALAGMKVAT
jgi:S-DNA-T family DNA segregation ATPase FtsK/SpoIIIE